MKLSVIKSKIKLDTILIDFIKNFNYVEKVVNSCKDQKQLSACVDWALSRFDRTRIYAKYNIKFNDNIGYIVDIYCDIYYKRIGDLLKNKSNKIYNSKMNNLMQQTIDVFNMCSDEEKQLHLNRFFIEDNKFDEILNYSDPNMVVKFLLTVLKK